MKRNRTLIDLVTGIALCGIFVAAGYAILSPNFTSFSTPVSEAILCGTNDCGMNPGTVDAGGSCACNPGMIMGSPPNETCMLPMQDSAKCKPGFSCQTNPSGTPGGFTCIDPCEGYPQPVCSGDLWHPSSVNHGEQCVFECKSSGTTSCAITPIMATCNDPHDSCNLNGSGTCASPCDNLPDTPYCDDPGIFVSVNIPEGGDCIFDCKNSNQGSCTSGTIPGGCDQTEKPLQCDPGTRKCVDPCAGFPGGLCRDIDLTTPVGEGEFCMLTCNEYNGTTCNSNGSRTVPCNSPDLTCNPTSRTCEPMCNGMPGACSSSSSSSAPQCCNLDTGMCQDI